MKNDGKTKDGETEYSRTAERMERRKRRKDAEKLAEYERFIAELKSK